MFMRKQTFPVKRTFDIAKRKKKKGSHPGAYGLEARRGEGVSGRRRRRGGIVIVSSTLQAGKKDFMSAKEKVRATSQEARCSRVRHKN